MALIIILLAFSLLLRGALGELVCEDLPVEMCAFAVASSGKRCLLETKASSSSSSSRSDTDDDDEEIRRRKKQVVSVSRSGVECKTSDVLAGNHVHEHIESDECVMACGLHRKSIGISSDNLLDSKFTRKICSPHCHQNCPNLLDLYHNLALGEGVYLPNLCKTLLGTSSDLEVLISSDASAASASAPMAAIAVSEVAALSPAAAYDDELFSAISAPAPAPPPTKIIF